MAGVRIDTGPIDHDTRFAEVRPDKVVLLLGAWRMFCQVRVPADCRELLRIVADAEANRAWEAMGFADLRSLIRDGLAMDPEIVGWAIEGLKALKPAAAVPLEKAAEVGKALRDKPGRPRKGEEKPCEHKDIAYGTVEHWVARLDRDRPDLAARVRSGELSANAAAVEAGFRKPRTAPQVMRSGWKRASAGERRDFLREVGAVFIAARPA